MIKSVTEIAVNRSKWVSSEWRSLEEEEEEESRRLCGSR
jgi:hypothetical protein